MKKLPILCLTALFACITSPLRAQQAPASSNPYDTLGRVLTPIASIFSPEAEKHALAATFVLEEMTGMPPELAGASFELLLEPPERFLVRTTYNGEPVTVCREGDSIWISPNIAPFNLLANPPEGAAHPKKKKNAAGGLGPMVLPFPPQQLALLPVLFQVREAAPRQGLRNLEVRLMPELAKNLGVEEWAAQLALNADKPERLRLIGPGWSMSLKVERLEVLPGLPRETWRAPADALRLDAPKVQQWMRELSRRVDTYRPIPNR